MMQHWTCFPSSIMLEIRTVRSLDDRGGTMFLLEIKFETVLSAVLPVFINSVITMQKKMYSARGERKKKEGKSSLKKKKNPALNPTWL